MVGRRVLVTGSSGVVGAEIAYELHRAGWQVRGIDVRRGFWTSFEGDLRDPGLRADAVEGVDGIVHTAALHAPHVGQVSAAEFRSVNVDATADLLEQAIRGGVPRFVYTSSTSVYGHALVPDDRAVWVDETLTPQPRDIYDETKSAAEGLVLDAHRALSTAVLRIARCFAEERAVQAAYRLYRGVDVRDVAVAHRLALENDSVGGVFNVAGPLVFDPADTETLWRDPRAALTRRAPQLVELFRNQRWPLPDRIDRVYDSRKAAKDLGYHPEHGPSALIEPPTHRTEPPNPDRLHWRF